MHSSEYKRISELEDSHFWYRAMNEMALTIVKNKILKQVQDDKNGKKILDAGCGTGGFTKKIEQFGDVYAVDINDTALVYAKRHRLRHLKKASVCALPYSIKYFDCVLSLDVLYHKAVKDDGKALGEIYRVLKPNGILIIRVPALKWLRGAHDVVVETRHRYTREEVKEKLIHTGFKIQILTYANMIISIPLFIKRTFERVVAAKNPQSDITKLPTIVNELLYRYLSWENKVAYTFGLPIGSSIICVASK